METLKTLVYILLLCGMIWFLMWSFHTGLNRQERYDCETWIESGLDLTPTQQQQCEYHGYEVE